MNHALTRENRLRFLQSPSLPARPSLAFRARAVLLIVAAFVALAPPWYFGRHSRPIAAPFPGHGEAD